MATEIERKFLVKNSTFKDHSYKSVTIKQGFLNSHKERVVRIRILDEKGYLTIKGLSSQDGTSRYEWEKEISIHEANDLLKLCEKGMVEKERYYIKSNDHIFEVDVFKGENEGLVVAEIELNNADESFEKPKWLGKEVTGDVRFYNAELKKNPFKNWA